MLGTTFRVVSRASSSQPSIATPILRAQTTRYPLFRVFSPASTMAYSNLKTPANCYVDFCLIPVGTGSASISREIADVQRVLKESGLTYTMHSAGTTVEGPWDEVMKVVGLAHSVVHQSGAVRVQSSMRAGSRTDKKQTAQDKIKSVENHLAQDKK